MQLDGRRLSAAPGLRSELFLAGFGSRSQDAVTRGYRIVDGKGAEWRAADLDGTGLEVIRVVGVSHRRAALQAAGFAPGEPVVLMPEPGNPHDPFALAVMDLALERHAGYVPATRSRALVEAIALAPRWAIALVEHRAGGERIGLRVLAGDRPLLGA